MKQREFSPPRALRNGQVQTMIGNLPFMQWLTRRRGLALVANAREWLLDCGDGVRLRGILSLTRGNGSANAITDDPAVSRIALILHGWEGSAESCYVVSLGAQLIANGFDVLRLNLRDHGESHHLNREIFHSCRLREVVGAARAVALEPDRSAAAAGANQLLPRAPTTRRTGTPMSSTYFAASTPAHTERATPALAAVAVPELPTSIRDTTPSANAAPGAVVAAASPNFSNSD